VRHKVVHLFSPSTTGGSRPADWIERKTLDPEALEDSAPLGRLYRYWLRKQEEYGGLPSRRAIDPEVLFDLHLLGFAHIVDVSADDPHDFYFRLFGTNVTLERGKNYTGKKVSEHPIAPYREAAVNDYLTVKMTGWPRLQRIRASLNFSHRSYQRLILPFSGDGGKPDRLLVAVRYEPFELTA
jgi:hypothetical protein